MNTKKIVNIKNQYYKDKLLTLLLSGVILPSQISLIEVKEILSDSYLLRRVGYNNHKLGYIFAISDSENIQRLILENKIIRELVIEPKGVTMAHIIAENPASHHIKEMIKNDKQIYSIENYNNETVLLYLNFYLSSTEQIHTMLRE